MKPGRIARAVAMALVAATGVTSGAAAAVPHYLSVQGMLSDSAGEPITVARDITFRIYDAETAGNLLWSETQPVTPDGGRYSVLLGTSTPLDLPFTQDCWLSIEVASDGEMTPFYRIASSAYAYNSETVNGIPAEVAPAPNTLLPLDGTGRFPNSVLNTGPGSGLDADTVDGKHAAEFADAAHLHDARYVPATTLADSGGALNAPTNPVDWSQLKGVPSDIADGDADTTYTDGAGILISGNTISADVGTLPGQVAAGDHDHDAAYINDEAGEIDSAADFGFAASTFVPDLDADTVDGLEASAFMAAGTDDWVNTAGDTMGGDLDMSGTQRVRNLADPALAQDAATKNYVDTQPGSAIASVDGVSNAGGNVDLVAGTGIAITPDDAADTITISSGVVSGITSVDGVSNDGGDVDLVAGAGINITPDDGSNQITIAATGADANSLDAADGAPVDAVYVDNDGKVGVGTATPATELDVAGTVTTQGLAVTTGAAGGRVLTSNASGDATWQPPTSPGVVPVGAVVAWLKSMDGTPAPLPAEFVECNGQTLADGASPYDGKVIPDLNGSGGPPKRFLRGSTASGATGGEDSHTLTIDEMPAHSHSIFYPKTTGSAGAVTEAAKDPDPSDTIPSGSAGGDQAHENRPPYYEVVWIMRIK